MTYPRVLWNTRLIPFQFDVLNIQHNAWTSTVKYISNEVVLTNVINLAGKYLLVRIQQMDFSRRVFLFVTLKKPYEVCVP